MKNIAIQVENIGKHYFIGKSQTPYRTLREVVMETITSPFKRLKPAHNKTSFWALRNISFDVEAGEIIGLIGRNGAGKSTLLKILSQITAPSEGRILLHGRVGSLLEVGTGFHPELTGRENVYMNGAVLGMRHHEIVRKFDEIVAFAEIEKFIDTPVKFYSSGMYLRLAFSVAAHLETEVLLVDEVLAVGDMNFQRKCLNKMEDVGQQGRTVVLVSHNMAAISRLCPRTIMLDEGTIRLDGPTSEVIALYLDIGLTSSGQRRWDDLDKAPGSEFVRLRSVTLQDDDGQQSENYDVRHPITIEMEYEVLKPGKRLCPGFVIYNEQGIPAFASFDLSPEFVYGQDADFVGIRKSRCQIQGNFMAEGTYILSIGITGVLDNNTTEFLTPDVLQFRVFDPLEGDSALGVHGGAYLGVVRPKLPWTHTDDQRISV